MLSPYFNPDLLEAGCDEAGRGCLAGSVFAAAVILPRDYENPALNDSKKLTAKKRYALREQIERDAVAWAVGEVTPEEIDKLNILHASFLAMHRAIAQLRVTPEALLIDGNRFDPYPDLPHTCIVKGDGKYQSIAAASILAKTFRDDYMCRLAQHRGTWCDALSSPVVQSDGPFPDCYRLGRTSCGVTFAPINIAYLSSSPCPPLPPCPSGLSSSRR